jgi:nucleoside phosphorylase
MAEMIEHAASQALLPRVDVLLVTVAEIEATAILDLLREKLDRTFKRYFKENKTYYDLGEVGGARTFMVQSGQGTGGPDGALLTIRESISALSPSAVVMVGIAFGFNPQKQRIGDILISERLQLYEHQRVSTDPSGKLVIQPRGDRIQASSRLLDRFRAGLKDWPTPTRVQFGLILSGEKLVDNQDFCGQLLRIEPEAIGGEMEGAGLYAAAQHSKVNWIMVKAICDWADGKKAQRQRSRQKKAAENAAQFTLHVLQQGGFTESYTGSEETLESGQTNTKMNKVEANSGQENGKKELEMIQKVQLTAIPVVAAQRGWKAWEATFGDISVRYARTNPSQGYTYVVTKKDPDSFRYQYTSPPNIGYLCEKLVELYGLRYAVDSSEWVVTEIFPFLNKVASTSFPHNPSEFHPRRLKTPLEKNMLRIEIADLITVVVDLFQSSPSPKA